MNLAGSVRLGDWIRVIQLEGVTTRIILTLLNKNDGVRCTQLFTQDLILKSLHQPLR